MNESSTPGAHMRAELMSQPGVWRRVLADASLRADLPGAGERVLVVGCGTSWFVAQAYAELREQLGLGETDAFYAAAAPLTRAYDRVIVITRSGTTSEIIELLKALGPNAPTLAIVGDPATPVPTLAKQTIVLDFADEQSVVQTRFATSAFMLLRSSLEPVDKLHAIADEAEASLAGEFSEQLLGAQQMTFIGSGWAHGLANEAALKMRESVQLWTESYYDLEYRHGPISIAAPGRVTWQLGHAPEGLGEQVLASGAHFEDNDCDPLTDLVRVHALALTKAVDAGLDPDHPRGLTRSVILEG